MIRKLFFYLQILTLLGLTLTLGSVAGFGVLWGFLQTYSGMRWPLQEISHMWIVDFTVLFLGLSGLAGLAGLWLATLGQSRMHKPRFRRVTLGCLLTGVLCGIALLYFMVPILRKPQALGANENVTAQLLLVIAATAWGGYFAIQIFRIRVAHSLNFKAPTV